MIVQLDNHLLLQAQDVWPGGPRGILHDIAPCSIHTSHTPVTIINELHHIFPEFLQRRAWGKTLDQTRVSVCATGHSSVHFAIDTWLRHGVWPRQIVGSTRELAQAAIDRYLKALER